MECLEVRKKNFNLHFCKNTYNLGIHKCSRSSVGLERLPAKEEVTGSSPVDCTIKNQKITRKGDFYLPIFSIFLY